MTSNFEKQLETIRQLHHSEMDRLRQDERIRASTLVSDWFKMVAVPELELNDIRKLKIAILGEK